MLFFSHLEKNGVLGMNSRNLDCIFLHNKRPDYHLVDNKIKTKALAQQANIKVPETYHVISYQDQIKKLDELLSPHESFVIKPAQGSGGGGITVIKGRTDNGDFLRPGGKATTLDDLRYHISNILGGLYALGGVRDDCIIEYCVENPPLFQDMAYQGVPDIRLVIYDGVPVMAMLRLPTKSSSGRANLHAGGIGVGISIRDGMTTQGILRNRMVTHHIDTGIALAGIRIPAWEDILIMASKAGNTVPLGYIGIDIVIDKNHGPMLLEMNARPGISIQIANRTGLKSRIEKIENDLSGKETPDEKIAYARAHFS